MSELQLIDKVKMALRITTDAFNDELSDLIQAAIIDLDIAGVDSQDGITPIISRAIITYCKCNFGQPDDYDRLKASYDEQKAQLSMATGYTTWTDQTS